MCGAKFDHTSSPISLRTYWQRAVPAASNQSQVAQLNAVSLGRTGYRFSDESGRPCPPKGGLHWQELSVSGCCVYVSHTHTHLRKLDAVVACSVELQLHCTTLAWH